MRSISFLGPLLSAGLLLASCGTVQTQIATVEVTRLVQVPQVETVEVTRVVPVTQVETVEVTRIVQETVVVTATPIPETQVTVIPGIPLQVSRVQHTATRLADGQVLLVGGSFAPDQFLAEAEIFQPDNGPTRFVTPLHTSRHDHTATILQDGRVLVVGGYNAAEGWVANAEVYDPSANTWTVVPPRYSHGVQHTATLMKDGRVLVVGGAMRSGPGTERVEIFDPQTNRWTEAMPLPSDRASHTAVLLQDGRVLVAGGGGGIDGIPGGGDALLYDPQQNSWTATAPMIYPRIFARSVLLPDGRVLVAGGMSLENYTDHVVINEAELYDPQADRWSPAGSLAEGRYGHILALLPNGEVIIANGARDYSTQWSESSFIHTIEIYNPGANRWHIAGQIPQPGVYSAAVMLADGTLWITGGQDGTSANKFLADTWLVGLESTSQ